MKSLQLTLGREKMLSIKTVIQLSPVRTASILITFLCVGILSSCSGGDVSGPEINIPAAGFPFGSTLEFAAPEEVGWSSEELQQAQTYAIQSGCKAVIALYDGKVFFSWGNIQRNYEAHSIRKPFLSGLYGIHFGRDNIDLNATLADLHIDGIPPGLTHAEKQAKVEYLLMSRSGVYHEAAAEAQVVNDTRPERGSHPPDSFFYYSNWGFNALGTIFEQETGKEICNAFKKEIADILEMVDFSGDNCFYQYEWDKSMHPAYHFRISARDMAKFGALYQKNGNWKGSQIIPIEWIDESTMAYSTMENTNGLGYGYMWKIIPDDSVIGQRIGHPGYFYTGADGHSLVIIPELKLVIVERYDGDQDWDDPGSAGFELGMMIIDARLTE